MSLKHSSLAFPSYFSLRKIPVTCHWALGALFPSLQGVIVQEMHTLLVLDPAVNLVRVVVGGRYYWALGDLFPSLHVLYLVLDVVTVGEESYEEPKIELEHKEVVVLQMAL